MRQFLLMCLFSCALVSAQTDHVYFKLDEGIGTSTLNYGTAGEPLGHLVNNSGAPTTQPFAWAPGAQGFGALGANAALPPQFNTAVRLDTRYYFSLGTAEPFTIAFFMKPLWPLNLLYDHFLIPPFGVKDMRIRMQPVPNANTYGLQLAVSTDSGSSGALAFIDYQLMTLGQWYHVAFVVTRYGNSSGTGFMVPYLNGVAQTPVSVSGMHNLHSTTGHVLLGNAGIAFDEFRISKRIVPPSEIALWASSTPAPFAAERAWNNACTPVGQFNGILNVAGDLPTLGNANYSVDLFAPYASSVLLVAGLGRQNPQNLGPLLSPQLNNCFVQPNPDFLFPTISMPPSGHFSLPAPIANDPLLAGVEVHLQAFGFNPWTTNWFSTNTFSVYIGY